MITPKKTSPTGKKPLPGWLRLVLVLAPICVCLPLTGSAIFVVVRQLDVQSANSTITALETVAAAETAGSRERLQATNQAATDAALLQAAVQATASALAANAATPTQETTPTGAPATATPTGPAELLTLTLIECRGFDGLVFLDGSAGRELLAFTTISFKVARGAHHLEVNWAEDPDSNVDSQIDVQKDTTMVFGDPCT